jgi:hypothetical protein
MVNIATERASNRSPERGLLLLVLRRDCGQRAGRTLCWLVESTLAAKKYEVHNTFQFGTIIESFE